MKRILQFSVVLLLACCTATAREYRVRGPQGGLATVIRLPDGFNPSSDKCPMVILMHGIFSSEAYKPIPQIAEGLAAAGIASIRFDFGGHWKSEGKMEYMTVEKEIADACAVLEYVKSLPYVDGIAFLGHSQGGVIASMTAGRLAAAGSPDVPAALVLIAPGSVIKDACQAGKFFTARFDPLDPPERVRCWGFATLGREYLVTTQQLDIYGTASAYQGPVYLIHGDADRIVPLRCSEQFLAEYGKRASLAVIPGENHTISNHLNVVVAHVCGFFKEVFFPAR